MEIDRRELKRQAREAIRVSRPSFWVVMSASGYERNGV